MKIEPQAGEFAATLALANYALDPKAKAEVASAVRVTAIAGEARLTVNALDRMVAITCRATVAEPGEAAVRAAALAGIVANLPPDATVSIETIGAIVRVSSGSACYRLATIPVGDLPAMLVLGSDAARVELEQDQAVRVLTVPASACDTGAGLYYLGGTYLVSTENALTAVGTDGHRLLKLGVPATGTLGGAIVSLASMKIAARLLAKTKDRVSLRSSRTLFELTAPGFAFVTKLINGKFPDYERVIPTASGNTVTVDRHLLVPALGRLTAAAEPRGEFPPAATLAWDADGLHLGLQFQPDAAVDSLAAETTGQGNIAVKLAYLTEIVGGIAGPTIKLDSTCGTTPIRITDPADPGLLALLMPLVDRGAVRRGHDHATGPTRHEGDTTWI